jgi:phosphoenolpyruvate-protein phosphotransferase/dihydroxyacetone kinase phosphotransfer subunit
MVGLVIVSHSRALADALVDLVKQVSSADVPLAVAAGVGPERQEFGTDATEIIEAIEKVYSDDGVLILMDLGSAILSAEMALELLPPEKQEKVRFCAAPVVEGAISAGVQAGLGSSLDDICREASRALIPKAQQLGQESEIQPPPATKEPSMPTKQAEHQAVITLENAHGLHARPAARFVQTAAAFKADIQVSNLTKNKGPASARSLNALATLTAVHGDEIRISASGPQSERALAALEELVAQNFGEIPEEQVQPEPQPAREMPSEEGTIQGVPVSEGIAIGPLFVYQPALPEIPEYKIDDPQAAWDRLLNAIEMTAVKIREQRDQVAATLGEGQAAIFEAHLLILQDPDLRERTRKLIFQERDNPAAAWHIAIEEVVQTYRNLEDPYLQQRAVDVLDVGNQVLHALIGEGPLKAIEIPQPVILFASDLTPSQTASLDMEQVLGLVTAAGGPTSHSAILARAMGIPALAGLEIPPDQLSNQAEVALDGFRGLLWIEPPKDRLESLRAQRQAWLQRRAELLESSTRQAVTHDGKRVEVAANIGNLLDARMARKNSAEAVGLLRTEFLFLTRSTPPSEDEQVEALSQISNILGPIPIVVRTLDVGGDKDLPYIDQPMEHNPFLGVRAIRLSLRKPDIFQTQLRAILRAGFGSQMRVMFPMIARVEEVVRAKELLQGAHASLEEDGLQHLWPIETGIMVEVPSAALLSDSMAEQVDFFSIGTNDLTQYTLAAERGNPALSELADALHPAVLRLIGKVAESAHARGRWVGVCGELAGEKLAAPVLVGLGVDELSMNPGTIPAIKYILAQVDSAQARELADQVVNCNGASDVRHRVQEFLAKNGVEI